MKEAKQKLKIEFDVKPEHPSKTNEKYDNHRGDKTYSSESSEKTAEKGKKELPQKLEMQPGVVLKFSSDENIDQTQLRVCKFKAKIIKKFLRTSLLQAFSLQMPSFYFFSFFQAIFSKIAPVAYLEKEEDSSKVNCRKL